MFTMSLADGTLYRHAHWARSVMERQVAILGELAEDGLAIAKGIKSEILDEAPKPVADVERLTRSWNRVARAVRLSLLLQSRVIRDLDALEQAASAPVDGAAERKARVQRIIGRVIDHQRSGARERMDRQVSERLDADFCGDLLARPISELVEVICRDLGLEPHWPSLAQEPWAKAEVEDGQPGWPLQACLEAEADGAVQDDDVHALSP